MVMNHIGSVPILRRIFDCEEFSISKNIRLFMFQSIMLAEFQDGYKHGIKCKRGEYVGSVREMTYEFHMTTQEIRTCLATLSRSCFLTYTSTNKFTKITLLKYNELQSEAFRPTSTSTNNQQTTNKRLTNDFKKSAENLGEKPTQEYNNTIRQEDISIGAGLKEDVNVSLAPEDEIEELRRLWHKKSPLMNGVGVMSRVHDYFGIELSHGRSKKDISDMLNKNTKPNVWPWDIEKISPVGPGCFEADEVEQFINGKRWILNYMDTGMAGIPQKEYKIHKRGDRL